MKLTKSLDMAVRILVRLAEMKKRLNARELSRDLGFSLSHVAKILQNLSKSGYVRTVKGKGGGVELAVPPGNIQLKDVIQSIDGPIYLMECTVNQAVCPSAPQCRLSQKVKEAQEKMLDVFRSTSVLDLLDSKID